ncbi:MAG: hypothetical protein QM740_20035 [Acidovorax sp.]
MGYLNPLLRLPAAQGLLALGAPERAALGQLLMELRAQANDEAENAWRRRKGPMACYWRAVSTYARHLAHVLRVEHTTAPACAATSIEAEMRCALDIARGQVAALVQAAAAALPEQTHPRSGTPESWARQLRNLRRPGAADQLRQPLGSEMRGAASRMPRACGAISTTTR